MDSKVLQTTGHGGGTKMTCEANLCLMVPPEKYLPHSGGTEFDAPQCYTEVNMSHNMVVVQINDAK